MYMCVYKQGIHDSQKVVCVCVCVRVCVYVLCVSMLLSMKCYSIIIQLQFAYNVLSLLLPLSKKDSTIKQLNLY